MKTDPGYSDKRPLIEERAKSLWLAKPPTTAQEATQILQQAYVDVQERLKKLIPRPVEKKVLPSSGSAANNGSVPKTLADLIERRLALGD